MQRFGAEPAPPQPQYRDEQGFQTPVALILKQDGSFDTTPEPDATIEPGDVIVGVGTTDELQRLEDLFAVG